MSMPGMFCGIDSGDRVGILEAMRRDLRAARHNAGPFGGAPVSTCE